MTFHNNCAIPSVYENTGPVCNTARVRLRTCRDYKREWQRECQDDWEILPFGNWSMANLGDRFGLLWLVIALVVVPCSSARP
jgi:hypothetical protein